MLQNQIKQLAHDRLRHFSNIQYGPSYFYPIVEDLKSFLFVDHVSLWSVLYILCPQDQIPKMTFWQKVFKY